MCELSQIGFHIFYHMEMCLRGSYGFILEGDEGHSQGFPVNLLSLLPVVIL